MKRIYSSSVTLFPKLSLLPNPFAVYFYFIFFLFLYLTRVLHTFSIFLWFRQKNIRNRNWISRIGNYSCLKVNLIFTRDRSFYFTTFFIPGIILVTSSFITFWLEWNAVPARSMIGKQFRLNAIDEHEQTYVDYALRRYLEANSACKYFMCSK